MKSGDANRRVTKVGFGFRSCSPDRALSLRSPVGPERPPSSLHEAQCAGEKHG